MIDMPGDLAVKILRQCYGRIAFAACLFHDLDRRNRSPGLADADKHYFFFLQQAGPIGAFVMREHRWIMSLRFQTAQLLKLVSRNLRCVVGSTRTEKQHFFDRQLLKQLAKGLDKLRAVRKGSP